MYVCMLYSAAVASTVFPLPASQLASEGLAAACVQSHCGPINNISRSAASGLYLLQQQADADSLCTMSCLLQRVVFCV